MNTPYLDPDIKKVYLAGPMRGLPKLNFPAFFDAASYLRFRGLEVVSPAEKDIDAGFSSEKQRPWIDCACEDARAVLESDAIFVLPGWEKSRGTRFEIMAALAADKYIPVYDYLTMQIITDPLGSMVQRMSEVIPPIARTTGKPMPPPPAPKPIDNDKIRTFASGATRTAAKDKHDYDGFLSPLALDVFGCYMHKHRFQADGKVRDSDNWQKGIPLAEYVKSAWRHFVHFWRLHRGYEAYDEKGEMVGMEDTLAALMFNIQGYCHEYMKAKPHSASKEFLGSIAEVRKGSQY